MTSIPSDIQAYVQMKLSTGQFASVDELAFAAIRVYRELEDQETEWKVAIAEAREDVEAGREEPWEVESIKQELRQTLNFKERSEQ